MWHSQELRRRQPNRQTPLRPAGKKGWISRLLIYMLPKTRLSPGVDQRRCTSAAQVSAPSIGGRPVRVERHKLEMKVVWLNFHTFTLSLFKAFKCLHFQTPQTAVSIWLILWATCIMSNILECLGEPGKTTVAMERAEAQVQWDDSVPWQAAWAIISINILLRNIWQEIFWQEIFWQYFGNIC